MITIFKGWLKYLLGQTPTDTEIMRARYCYKCDYKKKSVFETLLPDYSLKNIKGYVCKLCNCPLSTKIRSSNSKCPLKKW